MAFVEIYVDDVLVSRNGDCRLGADLRTLRAAIHGLHRFKSYSVQCTYCSRQSAIVKSLTVCNQPRRRVGGTEVEVVRLLLRELAGRAEQGHVSLS